MFGREFFTECVEKLLGRAEGQAIAVGRYVERVLIWKEYSRSGGKDQECTNIGESPIAERGADGDVAATEIPNAELSESSELFRGVFNQAAVGIAITGPDRKVKHANQKICEFLDCRLDEIVGGTLRAVTHPQFIQQTDEQIRRLVDGEVESATIENLYLRKDGTTVWGEWTSSLIRDEHGAPKYFVSVVQNIDDRKRAEAKAAETAALLENSQRIAHLGSWDLDIVEDKERWSDEAYRIFGLEPRSADFTGTDFLAYVHPEDREKAKAAQEYAIEQHQPYSVEYRVLRPDGTERTVYEYAELEFDDKGAPIRLSGTIQDVTEQRRAEKRLRESEAFFRVIFDQAAIGIAQISPDGHVAQSNSKFREIIGLHKVESESLFLWTITHPDDLEFHRTQFRRLISGQLSDYRAETRYVRADSTITWGDVTLTAIRDDAGRLLYAILVATEIEDRKKTELALRHTTMQLKEAQRLAHVGHWEWDPDTNESAWSDETFRIFGLDPRDEAPTHQSFLKDFIHAADRASVKAAMETTLRTGKPYAVEFRIVRSDGNVRRLLENCERYMPELSGKPRLRGVLQDITQLKQTEDILRETSRRLELAQKQARIGYWRWSFAEERLTYWSEEAAKISLYTDTDGYLGYEQFMAAIHPEDRSRVQAEFDAADEERRDYSVEYRIVDGEGAICHIREIGEVEYDDSGEPVAHVGFVQDITELRRIEQELRKSEQRLNAFFTEAPAGLALYDTEGRYRTVNETIARINGVPAEAHVGKRPSDILPREMAQAIEEANRRTLKTGIKMLNVELSVPQPTNPEEPGHYVYSRFPIPGADDKLMGVGVVVVDLTEHKRIESELFAREQELSQAQRLGKIGHWRLDLKKEEFTFWSDELYRIFGVDKNSFVPTSERYLAAIHEDDLETFVEVRDAAFAEKRPYQFEYRIVRPNGEIRVITGEGRPEFDESGEPVMVFGITQDVTEARQREAELRHAQKMEAVGQLTGGVAHDFNNLLGIIIGNLGLAQELTEPGTEIGNLLQAVARAADRGAALTKRLLAFSRKQPLAPEAVNVNGLVEHTLELLRRTLGAATEVRVTGDDELWTCLVDPAQLESAIVNLAINARDAMPDGGRLTIETSNIHIEDGFLTPRLDVKPGDYVVIAVSDNGVGMSPETLEHVFEPFFTTKDVRAGSGLGLPMVYGFTKQSGGHVTIYSEVGEGTTIRLYLPRHVNNSKQTQSPEPDGELAAASGEVILVVEDDEELRALVVNILRSLGYGVLESGSGKAALEILANGQQVHLLLTDLILPGGMNGRQLATQVQTAQPGMPVLFMSGYTEDAIFHQGRLGKGVQFLEKPFRKNDIAQSVRKALAHQSTSPDGP